MSKQLRLIKAQELMRIEFFIMLRSLQQLLVPVRFSKLFSTSQIIYDRRFWSTPAVYPLSAKMLHFLTWWMWCSRSIEGITHLFKSLDCPISLHATGLLLPRPFHTSVWVLDYAWLYLTRSLNKSKWKTCQRVDMCLQEHLLVQSRKWLCTLFSWRILTIKIVSRWWRLRQLTSLDGLPSEVPYSAYAISQFTEVCLTLLLSQWTLSALKLAM